MTAAASDGRVLLGPGERIGAIALVRGALARLRVAGWRAVIVWLVVGGAGLAVQMGFTQAGVPVATATATPGYLGYALVSSVVSGLSAAWGIRLMLRGGAGWLKPDRGLFEAAGLYAAMTAIMLAISALMGVGAEGAAEDPGVLVVVILATVLLFGYAFAALRLTLWPVARLAGRHLTAGAAWPLMRRATRGLLLAYVLVALPVIVAASVVLGVVVAAAGGGNIPPRIAVLQLAAGAVAVGGYGLIATLWTLRVEARATLADVFD